MMCVYICIDFHPRANLQAAPDLDPDQALGSPDLWCPSHEVETPLKEEEEREEEEKGLFASSPSLP